MPGGASCLTAPKPSRVTLPVERHPRPGAGQGPRTGREENGRDMSLDSVLQRKVRGPKMRIAGFPALDALCHTFAGICATRARVDLRPGIDVDVFGFEAVRHGDYLGKLKAPSAIYLLSYPRHKGMGLIKAHPRLLGKVLDIYLGGDGSFEESNFARSLTSIDLAIYGRFVDVVSHAFDEAVRELCGSSELGAGQRYRFEQQPGMVKIAPDRAEVFVIKLNFFIAGDTRGAGLDFVVPVATLEPIKKLLAQTPSGSEILNAAWARHMLDTVLETQIPLKGVIDLKQFTVAELSRLKQGQLFELPQEAIRRIELRAETRDGPVTIATGKLGAIDRNKAVRLAEAPQDEFVAPLRRHIADMR